MADWMDGLGGLAGGIGGVIGNVIQGQQAKQNAKDQFWYNLALQQQAQQWNLYLSNTQYQRGVADLKAAGINPILAAGGFSPFNSGSSGGSVQQADSVNPTEGVVSSAVQAAKVATELAGLQASVDKTKADTAVAKQTERNLKDTQQNIKADTILKGGQAIQSAEQSNLIGAQTVRERQTGERERLVGPGTLNNLQTIVPFIQDAKKHFSMPSTAQPHSAKSPVSPYGGLPPSSALWSGAAADPATARALRNVSR